MGLSPEIRTIGGRLRFGMAVILWSSVSLAFADTVTMQLIGPPPGPSMGGIFTSPYTAIVGGPNETADPGTGLIAGVPTSVICDDFFGDVSTSMPPWQATVVNMATLLQDLQSNPGAGPSNVVKFDHDSGDTALQQETDYLTVAYLSEALLAVDQSTSAGVETAGEISYAIWDVFDPSASTDSSLNPALTSDELSAVNNYLLQAQQQAQVGVTTSGFDFSQFANLNIFTPTPDQSFTQEFIDPKPAAAPEASSTLLLGADLLAFLAIAILFRRRGFSIN